MRKSRFTTEQIIGFIKQARDAFRHPPEQAPATQALSARIIELAQVRRRFGYRRLHDLLPPNARRCRRQQSLRRCGAWISSATCWPMPAA